jgi:hypothetical protein
MEFIINLAIEHSATLAVGAAAAFGFLIRHLADWIDAKAKEPQKDFYDVLKEVKDHLESEQ